MTRSTNLHAPTFLNPLNATCRWVSSARSSIVRATEFRQLVKENFCKLRLRIAACRSSATLISRDATRHKPHTRVRSCTSRLFAKYPDAVTCRLPVWASDRIALTAMRNVDRLIIANKRSASATEVWYFRSASSLVALAATACASSAALLAMASANQGRNTLRRFVCVSW